VGDGAHYIALSRWTVCNLWSAEYIQAEVGNSARLVHLGEVWEALAVGLEADSMDTWACFPVGVGFRVSIKWGFYLVSKFLPLYVALAY